MKLPSKRLLARLGVLSVVVALGGFAITQAHLALKRSDSGAAGEGTANAAEGPVPPKGEVQAIPDSESAANVPPPANPFGGSRLLPAQYTEGGAESPAGSPAEGGDPRDTRFRSASPVGTPPSLAPPPASANGDDASPTPAAPDGQAAGRESGFGGPPPPSMTDTYVPPTGALPGSSPVADRPGGFEGRNTLRSPPPMPAVPDAADAAAGAAAAGAAAGAAAMRYGTQSADGGARIEPTVAPAPEAGRDTGAAPLPAAEAGVPPAKGDSFGQYGEGRADPRAADSRFGVGGSGAGTGDMLPPAGLGAATLPPSESGGRTFGADNRLPADSQLTTSAPPGEGEGTPGEARFEGPQTPSVVIEKAAPTEIQVGKPARFAVKIRNAGPVAARDVVVHDQVPKGTRLIDTSPAATKVRGSDVFWELDVLEPNEEKIVSMEVMPLGEGEVGSVVNVTFSAQASARTTATRPELAVEHSAPRKVTIGAPVAFLIKLSNPGTGAATGVILEENVPEGLTHPAGNELEFEVGTLQPGETRELELTLTATKRGIIENIITCRADGDLAAEHRVGVEVIAPELEVSLDGPRRRYLERPATYTITIANPGTASANEVKMTAFLPKGMKFVDTNNAGEYYAEQHVVSWEVAELPAGRTGTVELTLLPIEDGEHKIRVEGRGDMNLVDEAEQVVAVEGLASLYFAVADSHDPIEVGNETMYEIRVLNEGSKTATNIRVAAELPPELKPLEGDGPARGAVQGQTVMFEPLARLAPKADALYKVRVQGAVEGDHRIRVQILSDEMQRPVTREERTLVYSDR